VRCSLLVLLGVVCLGCDKEEQRGPNDAAYFAHQSWRNSRDLRGFTYLRDKSLGPGTAAKYVRGLLG